MQFYSDTPACQDQWVAQRVFANRTTAGYFLDAGAADGVFASNSYHLEKRRGWTGILIEPNSGFYERLAGNRESITVHAALSNRDASETFIQAGFLGKIQSVAERFFPGNPLSDPNFQEDAGKPVSELTVAVRRLDTLLAEHNAPMVLDYISLDIEGSELDALETFPFDRHCFLALSVENYYIMGDQRAPAHHRQGVVNLLTAKGYQLVRVAGADDFFLHPSVIRSDLIEV